MLKTNLKQINNKRTLANLLKDAFLYDIVYQKQHKIRDPSACLSVLSF